jgi:hypothetical protein
MMLIQVIPQRARAFVVGAAGGLAVCAVLYAPQGSLMRLPESTPQPADMVVKAIPLSALPEHQRIAFGVSEPLVQPASVSKPSARPPSVTHTVVAGLTPPNPKAEVVPVKLQPVRKAPDVDSPFTLPLSHFLMEKAWMPEIPPVYQAVVWGDHALLLAMLQDGLDPNAPTPSGDTALCSAARSGNELMVRDLLAYGADPNLVGREQQTPLALCSLRRCMRMMRDLLNAGADPNRPFTAPVDPGLLERVRIQDLKFSLEKDSGVTPLMACSARGDVEAAACLLEYGAKASAYTKRYKRYPLNFAALQKYLFLMRVLLGRSPDAEPDTLVTVDLSQQRAWVTKHGEVVNSTSISSGRAGYSTPTGRYVVTDKHKHHTSTLYHVDMPWFMRLNCSAIGLHSGHVTGRPASHGCIRLPYNKAKAFFGIVAVGDEVEIVR